jgi:hypothetical protein
MLLLPDIKETNAWTEIGLIHSEPCNKDKLVGQKASHKLKERGAIRIRLKLSPRILDVSIMCDNTSENIELTMKLFEK